MTPHPRASLFADEQEAKQQPEQVETVQQAADRHIKLSDNTYLGQQYRSYFKKGVAWQSQQQAARIDEVRNQFKELEIQKANSDTNKCEKCGGRTALCTGFWSYEPCDEPYNSGVHEKAIATSGEDWVAGYKCDDCGHIQNLWHE